MNLKSITISNAIKGIKNREFSSEELTKECLLEIKNKDKNINSFITVSEKEALEDAKKADDLAKKGSDLPLLGVPIAVKDLYSTKGIKTTAGARILEHYIPPFDATVIKKIKEAGAVIIGKTNLDAWAHGSSGENSEYGPTKNPWDTTRVPGGSSSGSAAALASNMCIAATGTDTGGSIRLPASFCSVVGLKPTYGRVSRYGIIAMASSLDSIGHFTKTVEDSAILLSVTSGQDDFDATSLPNEEDFTKKLEKGIKGLKIGVPKEYITPSLDSDIKQNFERSIKVFEKLGAEIIDVSLPNTEYGIPSYYIIQPSEVSSNLARYDGIRFGKTREEFGDEAKRRIMLGTFTLSSGYIDAYYKKAKKVESLIKNDFEKVFDPKGHGVDALIAPVSPTLPWKLGEKMDDPLKMYLSDVLTVNANLAGIPALSIPSGFSKNKLPIGIQIMGKWLSESILFQIGNAFEKEVNL